jgi:hypothetical protein
VDSRGSFNEPNNREGSEFCSLANFTEATGATWGWADARCTGNAWPFICMTKRGARGLLAAAVVPGLHVCKLVTKGDGELGAASLTLMLASCLLPSAPGAVIPPAYTVNSTKNTFIFRTSNLTFSAASAQCNLWGGHLATYVRRVACSRQLPAPLLGRDQHVPRSAKLSWLNAALTPAV